MLKEFRDFIARGNVIDLAVGIIIGAAFGGVVNSLVNDIMMPPLGVVLAEVDFKNLEVILSDEVKQADGKIVKPKVAIRYGQFINTAINFLIVGAAVFLLVKLANRLYKRPPAPSGPVTKPCPACKEPVHAEATRCKWCTSDLGMGNRA